jgi:hypothetical protein
MLYNEPEHWRKRADQAREIAGKTAEMFAEGLSVPERVLLVCIASAIDWQKVAGLTHTIARRLVIRALIERQGVGSYALTDQGRAVLEALMMRATGGDNTFARQTRNGR